MSTWTIRLLSFLITSLVALAPAAAESREGQEGSESNLSDSETSYTGAVMLEGDVDITMAPVLPGSIGDLDDLRYGFFVGNTLYAGVEDEFGNMVDLIGEFFWFESSIDRGSDFYVGVFKVRTSPNILDDWRLQTGDPVLYLDTETDLDAQTGSFRWDWSVPFESYGYDSYGAVTLETEYGMGVGAEGAVMAGKGVDVHGVEISGDIQAKGFVNTAYSVRTQYQVTLWRWEVIVSGAAGHVDWAMLLNNEDRIDQNAYHEFFLVMQADEHDDFVIENLEFGGSVKKPATLWWDDHKDMSASLPAVTLQRPYYVAPPQDDEDEDNDADDDDADEDEDEDNGWWPGDDVDTPWSGGEEDDVEWSESDGSGCSIAPARETAAPLAFLALLLLGGIRRRIHPSN
jgi:MYXO-CTERM domain-containing protein